MSIPSTTSPADADAGPPARFRLTAQESAEAADLVQRVAKTFSSPSDPELLRQLPLLAAELPLRLREFLRRFSLDELDGCCVISGLLADDERIGPTPDDWQGRESPKPEFPEEMQLPLYSALLGEPFGWSTQQDGHFVNDVFPVRKYETERLGTGSKTQLTLHTEDAFHPYRADYILLSALRNPNQVPTTVAELDIEQLSSDHLDVLFEERFRVIPDTSHLPKNNAIRSEADRAYFRRIERLTTESAPASLLFGSRERPFLRFDETHMSPREGDTEARAAFDALRAHLLDSRYSCHLDAGDLLIINNHRAVHGRDPFTPKYDGTDRWLKRINVTTDLRKSADMRGRLGPRLVGLFSAHASLELFDRPGKVVEQLL